MSKRLSAQVIDFCITSYCSLACKRCIVGIPFIKNKQHTPAKEIDFQLNEIFKIWDDAKRLNLVGGEALLHPEIFDIVKSSLRHRDQFESMRITTNGTIMPEEKLLELIAGCKAPFDFVISNYGALSRNIDNLIERLEFYKIPYRVDNYVGTNQYFGGWVDLGDFTYMDYSEEEIKTLYQECAQAKTKFLSVYNGKVLQCVYSHHFFATDSILPDKTEFIDLYDQSMSTTEKRKIAAKFFSSPTKACRYCRGFNEKRSDRYPAAEQILEREEKQK